MTIGGSTLAQPLVVRRDPRARASDRDLLAQYALARDVDALLARVQSAINEADHAREKPGANITAIDAIAGPPPARDPRNSVGSPPASFTTLRWYASALGDLFDSVESADSAPTPTERGMWTKLRADAEAALRRWSAVKPTST
jgi:hypothetical protein